MRARPHNDLTEAKASLEIRTISSGPHFARETHRARDHYAWETRKRSLTNVNNLDERPVKHFKRENNDINFNDSDAHLVHHPHCNALVITAMMAKNNVQKILMDSGSSIDILYYKAFQKWA